VLLLEIGFWKSIIAIDKSIGKISQPFEAQEILIKLARGEVIRTLMGTKYSECVIRCLNDSFIGVDNIVLAFQKDVVDVLEKLATELE